RTQVGIREPALAQYHLADVAGNRPEKTGTGPHEGVELAALATWIDGRRELVEQRMVVRAPGEARVELRGVHADEPGPEPAIHEFSRQLRRVESPNGKRALEAERGHPLLAVASDILEKQIAIRNAPDLGVLGPHRRERASDRRLVRLVRAIRLEGNLMDRQLERGRLLLEQRAPDAVNADAVVRRCDARQQRDDAHIRIVPESVERQRAVLTAAPTENDLLHRVGIRVR